MTNSNDRMDKFGFDYAIISGTILVKGPNFSQKSIDPKDPVFILNLQDAMDDFANSCKSLVLKKIPH